MKSPPMSTPKTQVRAKRKTKAQKDAARFLELHGVVHFLLTEQRCPVIFDGKLAYVSCPGVSMDAFKQAIDKRVMRTPSGLRRSTRSLTPPPQTDRKEMNMNFKELLGKVTPGKWIDNGNEIVAESNPRVGIAGAIADSDSQYIARCNPQTMALVLEALEKAKRLTIETNENRDACIAAMTALDHLNSTP